MKVSVVMSCFNGQKYIEEQLDSILNQSHDVGEIIIIDDASTDGTTDILRQYNLEYKAINLNIHKKNKGTTKSFEEGIKLTTGDYIFLCDQDDIWIEEKVEKFLEEFQSSSKKLLFSDAQLIDHKSESLQKNYFDVLGITAKQKLEIHNNRADLLLAKKNIVCGAHCAFSKDMKSLILPLEHKLDNLMHDRYIAAVIAAENPENIGFIDLLLSKYRIHDEQQIGIKSKSSNEPILRKDYFVQEAKLVERILDRQENQHFRRAHYFWHIRSQIADKSFLQKIISINTLFLEGDYRRFTDHPIREALVDLKL